MIQTCLTVAGSDSGGEAGIQADLKTFNELNLFGVSVISAVTAQNPEKIISVNPVPIDAFTDQLNAIEYFGPQFIKSGLLYTSRQIEVLSEFIVKKRKLVADPLIISTSGRELMQPSTLQTFKNRLLPKTQVLTPNWPEIEILSGRPVNCNSTAMEAIEAVFDSYGAAVYLKGGHSEDPGTDFFYDGNDFIKLKAPVLQINSSHGTGCRLSSAFCGSLANGKTPIDAAVFSKNYVYHSLKNCLNLRNGLYVMDSAGKLENNVIEVEFL